MKESLYAAIEAGGTKFNCAIGDSDGNILQFVTIPTENPALTVTKVLEFFETSPYSQSLVAGGIGSFGPLCLDRSDQNFGSILKSPKIAWQDFNVYQHIRAALNIPIAIDTDVNAAALGEYHFGLAKDCDRIAYVTVGTGIGVGIVLSGQSIRTPMHPEAGHILLMRHRNDQEFAGVCPFHSHCLEGLASGSALRARWKMEGQELPFDHPAWEIESFYLAQLCVNLMRTLVPQKIIFGGGVLMQKHLLPLLRTEFVNLMAGYLAPSRVDLENLIVLPELGEQVGILGALQLAINNSSYQ